MVYSSPMERCPICGAGELRRVAYPGDARALRLDAILVCARCEAGSASPRPDQATLDRFYASGEYWHSASGRLQRAHEFSQAWLRVKSVRGVLPRRALAVADVGAGHGGIARALAALEVPVSRYAFVEPDPGAAGEIRALGVAFPVERLASLDALRGPFDLIFLNHVLEHVAEPQRFLEQAGALLAPQGIAYVETPHADYRFKRDVFPHLHFFTAKALAALGERLGVRTLACESFGRLPAPRMTPTGFVQRLAARALPHARGRVERFLDRVVWRYGATGDGIWLRWTFSPGQARQGSGTKAR
jgi:2-polyprenyl-3-methyl-5-hydroxy-6-metoxy-1,4-benzoquinol methylase